MTSADLTMWDVLIIDDFFFFLCFFFMTRQTRYDMSL